MIIDHINHCSRYSNCSGNIKKALDFLERNKDNEELQDGTYVIIPDEVIAYVVTKETKSKQEADMEIHKNFMDIHYMMKGAERCGVAPVSESIDYNELSDNGFYKCVNDYDVLIKEKEFYAVWPMEPHRPLCNAGENSEKIRKIICKVKVN